MFWRRRLKDTGQMKFRGFKRRRVRQEPEPLLIPAEPLVQQVVVAKEVEAVPDNTNTPVYQSIFIKLKRDRLLKFLVALLIGVLLLLLFLAVFGSQGNISRGPETPYSPGTPYDPGVPSTTSIETYRGPVPECVIIGDTTVCVKFAITNNEQIRGLRFTGGLAPNEGMLYLFNRADYYPFWTKDMQYPIDIIFIGSDKSVTDITESIYPCTESCAIYKPQRPAQYVLEVNGGFVNEHFIEIGDEVVFTY